MPTGEKKRGRGEERRTWCECQSGWEDVLAHGEVSVQVGVLEGEDITGGSVVSKSDIISDSE